DGGEVKLTRSKINYTIEFSAKKPNPIDTVVELETDGDVMKTAPVEGIPSLISLQMCEQENIRAEKLSAK
ncbi:MAG: hypothetical protein LBC19_05190, partial [Tannerella sp.]|nr:hypothetical protein [Tannerella sp.]